MIKTGAPFDFWLFLASGLLPLVPALLILIYRRWTNELFQWLLLGCLVNLFLVLLQWPTAPATLASPAQPPGQLAAFVIWLALYRGLLDQQHLQRYINYFLVAYISIRITSFVLSGITRFEDYYGLFQSAILVLLSCLVLIQVVSRHFLVVFQQPAFWIAAGLLTFNLVGQPIRTITHSPGITANAVGWMLFGLELLQYLCFSSAILVQPPRGPEPQD